MPGKCHTKNSSWQTTSRGCPLPSENSKNKPKHRPKEFWQTSTSKHQLQANQDKEKLVTKCRHLTVGNTPGVSFSGYFASCIVRSRLPTQWQARVASNQHHPSQTDKPEPTSDAQECAGRQEHTHDSSSTGQRLKSLAIHSIAESEWHESIHKILRKAVQRHAPCHKGLGSSIQVLASHLHHLSRRQDMWQGQRHASKQRTSIYSLVS